MKSTRGSTKKKRTDTRKARQFSAQPEDVKQKTAKYRQGGKSGRSAAPTKAELYEEAKRRGIDGRSRMSKAELAKALAR